MKYVTQFTVKQVCDILNVALSEEYSYMAEDVLTNIACNKNYLREGGAYFLVTKDATLWEPFLKNAIAAKVKIVFVPSKSRNIPSLQQIPHIIVDDAFECLIRMTQEIRNILNCKVIGVTGSLGKTTTKELICSVLGQKYKTVSSPGNLNTIYHLIETIQKLDTDTDIFIQEFGAGVPAANTLSKGVKGCTPDIGVVTNISDPHIDVYGTKENIMKEKIKVISTSPDGCPGFLNYDDELLRTVKLENHPIISYAVENKQADYYADNLQVFEDYMTFDIVHNGCHTPVQLNSYGTHNVANALVAAAVGEYFGLTRTEIAEGINAYKSTGIRQCVTNIGGYNLYLDCFNTAPASLVGAVDVLSRLPIEKNGKRIAVLGDIARLGDLAPALHRETGMKIAPKLDLVICYGNENAKIMADAVRDCGVASLYTDDREQLNYYIRQLITKNDIALFKGPLARLLSVSVDMVYGTAFHLTNGQYKVFEQGDLKIKVIYENDRTKKSAAILKYNGDDAVPELPGNIDDTDVFCIGPQCFFKNPNLQDINIPAPIYNISASAFRACKKLKHVTLPDTLKIIGPKAFRFCSVLEEIVIPEGVIEIGEEAFAHCSSLKRVVLPSTLGRIGDDAFLKCDNVKFEYPANSYAEQYIQVSGIIDGITKRR